jgi:hypothetical protein
MIFLLLFPIIANAADFPVRKFHIGSHQYVVEERKPNVWVSQGCEKKCKALVATEKKYSPPSNDQEGAVTSNPGAWICKNGAKGKVFIAVDEERNQLSFCKFDDGSYVNNGAFRY